MQPRLEGRLVAARSGTLARLPIADVNAVARTAIHNAYSSCVAAASALDIAVSDHDRQLAERRLSAATMQFDDLVFTAYRLSQAQRNVVQAT